MTFHEVADLFPLMDEPALASLANDIATNGLQEAIWLHPDGRVVDGRNRFLACERAGVPIRTETWEGTGSLVAFVLSKNLHRRHLTVGQRALIGERISNLRAGDNSCFQLMDRLSQKNAAELLNIGDASIKVARTVRQNGVPEVVAALADGHVTLGTAQTVSRLPRAEQAAAIARQKHAPPPKPRRRRTTDPSGRLDKMRGMAADGYTTHQIAQAVGLGLSTCARLLKDAGIDTPANRVVGKARAHDPNRIVQAIVLDAENLTADVKLIDFAGLDQSRLPEWTASLLTSKRLLESFIRRLTKEHGHAEGKAATEVLENHGNQTGSDAAGNAARHAAGVPEGSR